jgi:hypothetical protein
MQIKMPKQKAVTFKSLSKIRSFKDVEGQVQAMDSQLNKIFFPTQKKKPFKKWSKFEERVLDFGIYPRKVGVE